MLLEILYYKDKSIYSHSLEIFDKFKIRDPVGKNKSVTNWDIKFASLLINEVGAYIGSGSFVRKFLKS